ncbi:MAG: outer membrane lipoprotein carrier protein LolA [Sandaracinus sp.]
MTRLSLARLALFALFGLALVAHGGRAQAQDLAPGHDDARTVASWVQSFYDSTTSVEADFQQFFWTRVYNRTDTSRGRLRISRPGRIRFDYSEPSGKVVVGSEGHFTYYEPGESGGAGQYYTGESDSTSRALGFLMGTSHLARDFRFELVTSSTAPEGTVCLELRPRAPDPHYRRVRLYVMARTGSIGVVQRVAIEDPDGNWNTFAFSGFHFNREVAAGTFDYTPPAGAREITPPSSSSSGE